MDSLAVRQLMIGASCIFIMLDDGFHDGWPTPSIPLLQSDSDVIEVTDFQAAWVISSYHVGIGIGPLLAFGMIEKFGRKWTLVSTAIPKIVTWIMIGFAPNYLTLYFARLLAGVSSGITLTVVPIYVGEIADKSTRGPMGTSIGPMMNIGTLLVYAIGLYVSRMTLALICITVPVIFLLTFVWMPESPSYLIRKGRIEEAKTVLRWSLAQKNVDEEFEELKRFVYRDGKVSRMNLLENIKELVTRRGNRRALRVVLLLFTGMMFSGTVPILAYQSYIFEAAGANISTEFGIILIGISLVVAGWISITAVKFTGKRKLLLVSAPMTAFFLIIMALFFTLQQSGIDVSPVSWFPIVCMVGYVVFYAIGLDCMAYAYQGEVFPDNVRGLTGMICSLYYAVTAIATNQLYDMLHGLHGVDPPLWFFASTTIVIGILIYVIVPETEGKSLEVIQKELHVEKIEKPFFLRGPPPMFRRKT